MLGNWFLLAGDSNSLSLILNGLMKHLKQEKRWQEYQIGCYGFDYTPEQMNLVAKWFVENVVAIQGKEIRCAVINFFFSRVLSLDSSILFLETIKCDKKSIECLENMAKISHELEIKLRYYQQRGDEKRKLLVADRIKTVGELKLLVKKQKNLNEEFIAELDRLGLPDEAIVRAELSEGGGEIVFYRETGAGLRGKENFGIPISWLLK